MKLYKALLRRKELQNKLVRMAQVNTKDMFEMKLQRRQITDSIDDIQAQVPKLTWKEFNQEIDYYAKQLREIDGFIQQANYNTETEAPESLLEDYKELN